MEDASKGLTAKSHGDDGRLLETNKIPAGQWTSQTPERGQWDIVIYEFIAEQEKK